MLDFIIAPYFEKCSANDIDELNIEIIRNTLYKAYLEDFYEYCKNLGGSTAEIMCEILEVDLPFITFYPSSPSFPHSPHPSSLTYFCFLSRIRLPRVHSG